jgi:hypothetical protein
MARWFSLFLILILSASTAQGVSDPRPDVLGVYFDEFGERTCSDTMPVSVPFSVWLIYTNPTPASILGFEAGYHFFAGANYLALGAQWPCGIVWLVEPDRDNLYLTCTEPFPTAAAMPLVRFDYLFLGGYQEATFHVEKASGSVQPGSGPHIILADGSLMEVLPGTPAFISYICSVPTARKEWGTIKSLYR